MIMSNLNVALEQKERSALFVAQIANTLGADGAVVAEEGYGNPDADFIGCYRGVGGRRSQDGGYYQ